MSYISEHFIVSLLLQALRDFRCPLEVLHPPELRWEGITSSSQPAWRLRGQFIAHTHAHTYIHMPTCGRLFHAGANLCPHWSNPLLFQMGSSTLFSFVAGQLDTPHLIDLLRGQRAHPSISVKNHIQVQVTGRLSQSHFHREEEAVWCQLLSHYLGLFLGLFLEGHIGLLYLPA